MKIQPSQQVNNHIWSLIDSLCTSHVVSSHRWSIIKYAKTTLIVHGKCLRHTLKSVNFTWALPATMMFGWPRTSMDVTWALPATMMFGWPRTSMDVRICWTWGKKCLYKLSHSMYNFLLPPSQIVSHSKNLGESKHLKFDQVYIIR